MITNKKLSWNRIHYKNYEKYCMNYHQENSNQITYHWDHVPESVLFDSGFIANFYELRMKRKGYYQNNKYYNIVREYGLDGISVDNNLIYHGIQCKLWNNNQILNVEDLETFFKKMNDLREKNENSKGYLYHTCKLSDEVKNHTDLIDNHIYSKKINYNEKIQNQFFNIDTQNINTQNELSYTLRNYQEEAINALNEEWYGNRLLHLPCGMGKTLIFCNHVKNKDYQHIFIISPLQIHTKQNLERIKIFLPDYHTLLLDSDSGGTTDYNDLIEVMKHKSIISSTFASAKKIIKQLFYEEENHNKDDDSITDSIYETDFDLSNTLLIVDEAHNIGLDENNELLKIIKSFPKVLLVTATPPSCMEEVIGCEVVYQYPFRKAIEEGFICDYQIYIPMLDKSGEVSKVDIEKPIELSDFDDDLVKKSLYLINSMLQTGSKRCIAYLSSQEECNQFINIFKEVVEKYHYLPYWIKMITNEITSKKEREAILEEFQNEDDENSLKILCSIRILDEGVDIPLCDSIFISNLSEQSSNIRMVQRICRANRLVKNHPNKVANCFLWTEDVNSILDTLSLLKENDIEFYKKIKVMNGNYDNKNEIEKCKKENKEIGKYVLIKCLNYNERWEIKKQLLFEYCDNHKKVAIQNKSIGCWLQDQKKKIKSVNDVIYKKLSENIYVKESLDKFLLNKENNKNKIELTWDEWKELLFKFSNYYQIVPKQKEKFKNKKIGSWFFNQKTKINDDIYIKLSENEYVKKSLDDYLIIKEKNKDKNILSFDEKKNILFDFCIKNNKAPINSDDIGIWLQTKKGQINSINDELYKILSQNEIVKKSLDEYLINKEKNKDKNQLSWDEKKNILFKFCNKNKRVTINKEKIENENIGMWFQDQKKKINSSNEEVYIKLSENEYLKTSLDEYLINKEKNKDKIILSWDEKKELLFNFSNNHQRVPKNNEEYKNENIGRWLQTQKEKMNEEKYKKLSENIYVKISLDAYLANKNITYS